MRILPYFTNSSKVSLSLSHTHARARTHTHISGDYFRRGSVTHSETFSWCESYSGAGGRHFETVLQNKE